MPSSTLSSCHVDVATCRLIVASGLQDAMSDVPCAQLGVPLSNYVLLFFRSSGAYKTVLDETGILEGDMWQLLHDWVLLLLGLNLVVQGTDTDERLKAAMQYLVSTFKEYYNAI